MTLSELREKPHISYSQIYTYLSCSLKYKFSYLDRVTPDFTPLPLVFGSTIHKCLAEYYQNLLEGNQYPLKNIQTGFQERWETLEELDSVNLGKETESTVIEKGIALLSCFYEKVSPNTILAIEQPFSIQIDTDIPPLIGAIDLIEIDAEGNSIIVDHKTSSSRYSKEKVERDLQMSVYSLATVLNGFAYQNPKYRFDILVKTKTPQFQQSLTSRTRLQQQRAVKIIREVWKGITGGIFVPNDGNNFCFSCQYRSYCDRWG